MINKTPFNYRKVSNAGLLLVLGIIVCLFTCPNYAYAAVSAKTLLVDDFSDYSNDPNSEVNNMKYWDGGGQGLITDEDISDPGIAAPYPACHKITWQDGPYQWWATCLWDGLHPDTKTNLLRYTHIAFEVKGAVGGEDFYVGLQESNKKKFDLQIKASDFVQDTAISTEWKTIRIPLNKFIEKPGNPPEQPGVNLNKVQAVDFMFYEPGNLSGTIYVANIRFEGVKIDDFQDSIFGENLLRLEYSTGADRMVESSDIADTKIAGNKCHKLAWDISNPAMPGFWYTCTYFEPWNVVEPTDISLYDTLNIRVRGETGGEIFKVEFQEAVENLPNNNVTLSSSGYVTVTTDWKLMSIPLADFETAGVGDKNNMTALALLFGSTGDTAAGTIYIDDIYLAYDNQAPTIGGSAERTFYVNYPNSFRIPGSDPEDDHLVYSTANLPQGAALDPRNGLITWRPAVTGNHGGVTLKAKDGMYTATKSITIHVIESPAVIKPQSTGLVKVDKVNKKLIVDGKEFITKGIGYNPIPIGVDPSTQAWDFTDAICDRDFPILREMRVNTIRTWNNVNYVLLNHADSYGIKVCASFWVDPSSDFTDPAVRAALINDFKLYVSQHKDYPALLMWVLGNEIDYNLSIQDNIAALSSWYSLANEMAQAAYEIEGSNYHPVALSAAFVRYLGDVDIASNDATLNYIDIWAMNVYLGYSFLYKNFVEQSVYTGGYFADYGILSDKPLFIAEYGIDSFYSTTFNEGGQPTAGNSMAAAQSAWEVNLTNEILTLDSSLDVCIGGSLMAYTDEWWKYTDGDAGTQEMNGFSSEGAGNDVHPDDFANEEYWGIFAIADNGADPDILTKKQETIEEVVYSAYNDIRDQCFNAAPVVTDPKADTTFYVGQNNGFYVIANDSNGDALKVVGWTPPTKGNLVQQPNTNFSLFSWSPAPEDVGDVLFTFVATEDWEVYDPDAVKSSIKQITIHVVDGATDTAPPVAEAGDNITAFEGRTVSFDGSASSDNVGIMNYQWDFSYEAGNFNMEAEGPLATKVFNEPGVYTAALKVNDGAGNGPVIDTLTVTVVDLVKRVNVPDIISTIQAAVYLADSGDEVYVLDGEYPEDIFMKSGVSLVGKDTLGCVIKGSVAFREANNSSIENFTVKYPEGNDIILENAQYPAPGMRILGDAGVTVINSNASVKDCIIVPDLESMVPQPTHYGKGIQIWNMYNTGSIQPNIENNLIRNADIGIFTFSQAFGGEICGNAHNNTLENNVYGIVERMHKENILIQNNIITNSLDAIHLSYQDGDLLNYRSASITDNDLYGNTHNVWCDETGSEVTPSGTGNISVNPLYTNPPADYTPLNPDCSDKGCRLW